MFALLLASSGLLACTDPADAGPGYCTGCECFPRLDVDLRLLDDAPPLLQVRRNGEIVVDERGQTSVPGVFAAGDCTVVPYKQIVIAMGSGSVAALSAFDHLVRTSAPAETAPRADDRQPAVV